MRIGRGGPAGGPVIEIRARSRADWLGERDAATGRLEAAVAEVLDRGRKRNSTGLLDTGDARGRIDEHDLVGLEQLEDRPQPLEHGVVRVPEAGRTARAISRRCSCPSAPQACRASSAQRSFVLMVFLSRGWLRGEVSLPCRMTVNHHGGEQVGGGGKLDATCRVTVEPFVILFDGSTPPGLEDTCTTCC
ncbi:hypothetical protein H074_12222 [Amycolatopsis decaplanina DSM 44594]|uniref:Uncharacterized protein n=2 Tax=Amycolatopsis decaplanina TaxID=208441 RepID=M2ZKK1_9PSEU|nr:hypothetical protein H074_12222 [Amycolatopsis decaplanina DSM 44594]